MGSMTAKRLSKFRGKEGYRDANEFMETFTCICKANGILESRFAVILPICLQSVERHWFTSWIEENPSSTWVAVEKAFLMHFSNPHQMAM